MDKNLSGPDTTGMDEEIDLERLELLDRAEELARQMFEYPTETHVEGVLDRLLWNELHGLGEAGAATLH
ncbi:hypothetical protein [Alcaligenes sp. SDU_A2]|uniref:hypothetical protein n=1 Tax=Alcaligenes sp. SDU_A2 TaxID=3136634 RepID=UPI00311FC6C7